MTVYKPHEFAKLLGVTVKTLQRWDNIGRLKAYRSPSNRRYYTDEHYHQCTGIIDDKPKRKIVAYTRVSSRAIKSLTISTHFKNKNSLQS